MHSKSISLFALVENCITDIDEDEHPVLLTNNKLGIAEECHRHRRVLQVCNNTVQVALIIFYLSKLVSELLLVHHKFNQFVIILLLSNFKQGWLKV